MIRVFIVGDAGLIRKTLARELSRHADVSVVGSAADADSAGDKIATLRPDVAVLELDLPRLDGLAFLEKLGRQHPVPTVVVSTGAPGVADNAIRALALGAIEVATHPDAAPAGARELIQAVRAAAAVRRAALRVNPVWPLPGQRLSYDGTITLMAIGAATGGSRAIEALLTTLPANAPAIVVVQHMPALFIAPLVKRLDALSALRVREARDGDLLAPGGVWIAPGEGTGRHMIVRRERERLVIRFTSREPVSQHRPSVDVLFESVAECAGRDAAGVLLTGMGTDGARGLLAMRQRGARTFAQDEESCVVYGMPGEAVRLGAVEKSLPPWSLASAIVKELRSA
jgi:two-component system chemotaxis response regulator CheB